MWANDDDGNDKGEPVRLYQPIPYRARLTRGFENPTISRIGGPFSPSCSEDGLSWRQRLVCSKCQDPLFLLAQLHVPLLHGQDPSQVLHRTIQVLGCNRASCFLSLFDDSDNKLNLGGGGVVRCRRFHIQNVAAPEVIVAAAAASETQSSIPHAWDAVDSTATDESPWGTSNSVQPMKQDDWGVDDDDANADMQGIESMVAEMEMKSGESATKKRLPTKQPKAGVSKETDCFPCFEIHSLQEPARRKTDMVDEDDEDGDDDVGISSSSDDKIQQMLARYMAEEDDEEILSAIRGGGGASNAGGGGGGKNRRERDERLAPEDRALFAFTDRIKRAPRQVIRYARGGTPMWSVPVPSQKKGNNRKTTPSFQIPACSCGAERIFECQLLPSLLHVLEVDKHTRSKVDASSNSMNDLDVKDAFESGGMNWGSIAIYTCSQDCAAAAAGEEFVVVQDSLDGKPQKMSLASDQMAVLVQDQPMESDDDDDNEYTENWDVDDDGCDDEEDFGNHDDDDKPTKLCSLKVARP